MSDVGTHFLTQSLGDELRDRSLMVRNSMLRLLGAMPPPAKLPNPKDAPDA